MNSGKAVEIDPQTLQVRIDGLYCGDVVFGDDGVGAWQTPEDGRGVDVDRVTLSQLCALMAQVEADRE